MIVRFFGNFLRDRRGNFTVLSALMLVGLAGVAGLVTDYGSALYSRLRDQRVADIAAVAGARIYDETESATAVRTAVANVAVLNGIASPSVSESIVTSPTGDGNQAVMIKVTSMTAATFTRLLRSNPYIPVSATSYAEMKPGGAGCIIALSSSGTGVTATGGTAVTASNCAVASNQTITCSGGGNITAQTAYYYTTLPACGAQLKNAQGQPLTPLDAYTADPLAGASEVLGQTGRLATVEAMASPSAPTVPAGTDLAFSTSSRTSGTITAALTAQGCTGSLNSSVWTVTCPAGITATFGTVSVGSATVNFNVAGSSTNKYNFKQVATGAGTLNFGPGTYNIAQGIVTTNGSAVTTFGAGTFNVGGVTSTSPNSCNATSTLNYSICVGGPTMTFAGPSTFVLAGGIYVKGSETLTLGSSGTTNSFNIGKAADGNSLNILGGSIVSFGDATGSGDIFQMAGNMNDSSGGTCLKISAATYHDINGYFLTAGGNSLGSGVYTVADYVSLGGSNGGNVTCWGSSLGMNAPNTTFVVGGNALDSSGHAFYVGAGYDTVTLSAPGTGNTQGLAVIGPTTSSNVGTAVMTEGATNTTISGAFYFPYGAISLSGAASVGNGTGQCLEVIGKQVTLTGGATLASSCNIPGVGTSGVSGLVSLVQ
jgi:Flp pilus assembly protein TadG